MATMMTGNVFFVIMPNQRKSVAALLAGSTPDPKWGKTSKTRSTHNNYITLPVLFMMLSNHYPVTFSNPRVIPAIVTCVIVAGALVRYFYNRWHVDHDQGAVVGLGGRRAGDLCAFFFAATASPGMRELMGLADLPVAAARADEPKAPQEVVDIVHDALLDVPRAGADGGDRRSAEGRAARHARAHRALRAGDPHAGGADPRHAAQQFHADDRRGAGACSPAG